MTGGIMKAIQVREVGGPEVLKYVEVPSPEPGPGEAVVEIKVAGVNYMDIYARDGSNQTALPFIPGGEGAGIVGSVGDGVTGVTIGDRVTYTGAGKSYAEKVVVPAWRLIKIPDGLDIEECAASMLQGMTAHYLSHSTYALTSDDVALIHSGAGGVGLLLIQMAKMCGAQVITTVSTDEKASLAKEAGADHTILYTRQSFGDEVGRITGGMGVQVVYDAVGATTFDQSINSLAVRGCMVLYGQSSGPVLPVAVSVLNAKSIFLTRPSLGSYTQTRIELEERAHAVLGWVKSGELKLRIHDRYPLAEAAEAHRELESRLTSGKLLLIP
jgi:NADPH2:quinone reductase